MSPEQLDVVGQQQTSNSLKNKKNKTHITEKFYVNNFAACVKQSVTAHIHMRVLYHTVYVQVKKRERERDSKTWKKNNKYIYP